MTSVTDEAFDVVVIGGGQAGLAAGYHLARTGRSFVVLDAHDRLGDSWRLRWDSLRLFTPARFSRLPGLALPVDPNAYATKDELAAYLEAYAARWSLPVRLATRVDALTVSSDGFALETKAGTVGARAVIVATGAFHRPRVPPFARRVAQSVVQLHSSAYRNGRSMPPGDVLVVGAGNSGVQIARDLVRSGRRVVLAGRAPGHLPQRALGRDIYAWAYALGAMRVSAGSWLGRRARRRSRGDPLVGTTLADVARDGVTLAPRAVDASEADIMLEDGKRIAPRAVIWATGFHEDFSFLRLSGGVAFDASGSPVHRRGISPVRGLYFLGLRWLHRADSSLLNGVGRDAEHVVDDIARMVR
jgi:putative flavoprotein involved in K+ transport